MSLGVDTHALIPTRNLNLQIGFGVLSVVVKNNLYYAKVRTQPKNCEWHGVSLLKNLWFFQRYTTTLLFLV